MNVDVGNVCMNLIVGNIKKAYGEHEVLRDVSFSVSGGSVSVLMGTNGSGKTTLFNIISGFVPQDAGDILLGEDSISKLKPYQRKRCGIGRTFQDMRLIGDLSVKENVMLAYPEQEGEKWWKTFLPNKKVSQEQKRNSARANQLLEDCFIDDIAKSKANEISYGQQKLLNLACCMASDASVLLLDEPAAGVNPVYRQKLATVVKRMKEQGKALLVIEHNSDFIETVADEIFFLHNGLVQRYSSYQEFRESPEVLNAYV